MTEVRVPDIGDFTDVPIIEVHVEPGATVEVEDPLITLESDKATMDVPSPVAGTVSQLAVQVGDRVSQGSLILSLEPAAADVAAGDGAGPAPAVALSAVEGWGSQAGLAFGTLAASVAIFGMRAVMSRNMDLVRARMPGQGRVASALPCVGPGASATAKVTCRPLMPPRSLIMSRATWAAW